LSPRRFLGDKTPGIPHQSGKALNSDRGETQQRPVEKAIGDYQRLRGNPAKTIARIRQTAVSLSPVPRRMENNWHPID
jgi:hypothetical protein